MRFTALALAGGLAVGLLAGGRPQFAATRTLRWWPALLAGMGAQAVAGWAGGRAGAGLLVASYVLLLVFAVANVATVGMWMVATGIAMNLAVIAVNDGMPVRPAALVAAGVAEPDEVGALDLGSKHHLERPSDRLVALGDVIPVAPLREVLSFGDVVMAVGAADVLAHLLAPSPRRRSRSGRRPGRAATAQAGA